MNENNTKAENEKETSMPFGALMKACARGWKWILASVIICTGVAGYYAYTTEPTYERTMSILIKDQSGPAMPDISTAFSAFGIGMSKTNVYNELISLMSPDVMEDVVADLDLQTNYIQKKFPYNVTLYGTNLPFVVTFPDLGADQSVDFEIHINHDKSLTLTKFRRFEEDGEVKFDKEVRVPAGSNIVTTPIGKIQITPNQRFKGPALPENTKMVIIREGFARAVERYVGALKGDLADHEAEVINISLLDNSKQRADDVLSKVLEIYTSKWIDDKNKIAIATSKFIDERLVLLQKDLGDVDSDIMDYKSSTLVPDLEEAAKLNMKSAIDMDKDILEVSTKLSVAQYVGDYIKNPANAHSVIPVNTGGMSVQLESQIGAYNTMLLTRNNLAKDAAPNNPILQDYDAQLSGMREAIDRAVRTQIMSLESNIRQLESAKGGLQGQLASGPAQAKHLLSAERQQKVKESLYIYLLQKREENELNQKFTADNTRIITPPHGSLRPVSPRKKVITAMGFLFGLLFPCVLIYLRESSNTKVRSRKDLERMSTPLVGEIPQAGKRLSLRKLAKFHNRKDGLEELPIKVSPGSRDLINESFRILRGNIEMMGKAGQSESCSVYLITSLNPGSGKSFVTYNLAASFAIKGKKVLIVDCDLRHGSTSQYVGMPTSGLTTYLNGKSPDWKKLVIDVKDQHDLNVLPIGRRPPNPAELLDSEKMSELIGQVCEDYDIVLLDCPPVDVVVDTQILAKYATRTLFVVRAGLLEKSAVDEIDMLRDESRFSQMGVILNGTEQEFSRFNSENRGYYGSEYTVDE